MLWYKAWRESRVRFLIGAALIAFLCWQFLSDGWRTVTLRQSVSYLDTTEPIPYSKVIWHGVWAGGRAMFVMVALLLGLGGLQRERVAGTIAFTLALPATRRQLVVTRAAVGVLQTIALASIPVVMVPMLSPVFANEPYAFSQALQFGLLYVAVGLVCYAAAFLCSTTVQNEHTVVAICLVVPFAYTVFVDRLWRYLSVATEVPLRDAIRHYRWANVFDIMAANDMPYRDTATFLLTAVPWTTVLVLLAIAAFVLALAGRLAERTDF